MRSVLVLGGSTEAGALARRVQDRRVVLSLAGRVERPADHGVELRVGGFGGAAGLASHLRAEGHGALVDATHPFAAAMPFHAAGAAAEVGIPSLRLLRPPWTAVPGDRWHEVDDLAAAAAALDALGSRRPFLALGRGHLAPFATTRADALLVRSVDEPDDLPDDRFTAVTARGPFDVVAELDLLLAHAADAVVARNAGGTATRAKLDAARRLGLPVVLVRRPPQPAVPTVGSVDEALAWLG